MKKIIKILTQSVWELKYSPHETRRFRNATSRSPESLKATVTARCESPPKRSMSLGLFWWTQSRCWRHQVGRRTRTLPSVIFHIQQQKFGQLDSTVRKNNFQHFWMTAAFRTSVHQQRSWLGWLGCIPLHAEPKSRGVRVQYVYVRVPWSFLSRQLLSSTS